MNAFARAGLFNQPRFLGFSQPAPRAFRAAKIGQGAWVEVRPDIKIDKPSINAPINIELGGLPLSLGFFAGSGLAFLVRTGVPRGWPQTTALVVGSALAVAGIVNLLMPKAKPGAPAPAAAPAVATPPSGIAPAGTPTGGFVPPSPTAFADVDVEMVSPQSDQDIANTGTFLGIGTPHIPLQLRLYNPNAEAVTLNLEFDWNERPSIMGYSRDASYGSKTFQLTLGPNEQRNETLELPMVTSKSTYTTVGLALYKKRTPNENRVLVLQRTFNVT